MNFDTTALFKTIQAWEEEFNDVSSSLSQVEALKGKLNDSTTLLKALETFYALENRIQKLYIYIHLNHDTKMAEPLFIEKKHILDSVITKFYTITAYISPELKNLSEDYLNSCIEDERFSDYSTVLLDSLRSRPHTLSEKEEKLLSAIDFDEGFDDVYSTLTNVNFTFKGFYEDGKKYPLTDATYIHYLENNNRAVRKKAFNNYYATYKKFNDTIATNFIYSLKEAKFRAQTRNHEGALEKRLFAYNLDKNIYYSLIKNVNNNLNLIYRYYEICKKVTGIEDFTYYDLYLSISEFDKKITYAESIELIKKAVAPLSNEYQELVDRADKERWIDVYPKKNKRSGAYETAAYGVHPYILTNFTDNVESCFTLIHELGHAMHTYFTNKVQPFAKSDYSIYLAEIASTVNEILLLKYLLNNTSNKQEKLYYVDKYIKMFKGTVYRQTMFSEFEDFAHNLVKENKPISMTILNEFYGNLNKKYFPACVKYNENISYEWSRIPHFYSPFYVFNYATSFTAAVVIAHKILESEDNAKKYLHFLSCGSSKYPNELLNELGVDLSKDETYSISFGELKNAIDTLEELIK